MTASNPDRWAHRGARALVLLHERELHAFLETWRRARAAGLALPATDDPDYVSLEALLRHVLACARYYLTWIGETLELDLPELREAPAVEAVADEADPYLEYLLAAWRAALRDVEGKRFDRTQAAVAWGPTYCVDALAEHAVMPPVRHRFQLEELLSGPADA